MSAQIRGKKFLNRKNNKRFNQERPNPGKTDESAGAMKYFVRNPFAGNSVDYRRFAEECKTVFTSDVGAKKAEYLTTDWPLDAQNFPTLPPLYQLHDELPSLDIPGTTVPDGTGRRGAVRDPTDDERKDRRERNKEIRAINQAVLDLESSLSDILLARVTETLATKYTELANALKFWYWLRKTYGEDALDAQGKGVEFTKLIAFTMRHQQRFDAYIMEMDRMAKNVTLSEDARLGLIMSDGTQHLKIRYLPKRLEDARALCVVNNYDYKKSCETIIKVDRNQHQKGLKDTVKEEKVNAVKSSNDCNSDVYCYNCSNHGHRTECCRTPICGYCKLFDCGHSNYNCPKRLGNKGNNKRSDEGARGSGRGGRGGRGRGGRRGRGNRSDGGGGQRKWRSEDFDEADSGSESDVESDSPPKRRNKGRDGNDKKKQKRTVRRVRSSEEDGDSDVSYDEAMRLMDDIDNDCFIKNSRVRRIKRVSEDGVFHPKMIKVIKRIEVKKVRATRCMMQYDSGADATCNPRNARDLFQCLQTFDEESLPDTKLAGATGDPLNITGRGVINEWLDNVWECDNLEDGVISGQSLRSKGLWAISPPSDVCKHAVILADKTGQVVAVSNKKFCIDIRKMGKWRLKITLPDISSVCQETAHVNKVYGLEKADVKTRVEFVNETYLVSKDDLKWMSSGDPIKNFPVNSYEVEKYYVTLPARIAGTLQLRKSTTSQFRIEDIVEDAKDEKTKSTPEDFINSLPPDVAKRLNYDRTQVGAIVGSDFYGPYMNVTAVSFIDGASGFGRSTFVKHSSRKGSESTSLKATKRDVPKLITWVDKLFKLYGHKIQVLATDKDIIYKSAAVRDVCLDCGIFQKQSPPGMHALNGLAESYHKTIPSKVTGFYYQAPYMFHQLWPEIWMYAELVNSFRQSKIPGSQVTRFEEFTHEAVNCAIIPMLPPGRPCAYYMFTQVRKDYWEKKMRIGMYIGPDLESLGCAKFYNPITQRKASRSTYRILEWNQVPYQWRPLDPFSFVRVNVNHATHAALVPIADEDMEEDVTDGPINAAVEQLVPEDAEITAMVEQPSVLPPVPTPTTTPSVSIDGVLPVADSPSAAVTVPISGGDVMESGESRGVHSGGEGVSMDTLVHAEDVQTSDAPIVPPHDESGVRSRRVVPHPEGYYAAMSKGVLPKGNVSGGESLIERVRVKRLRRKHNLRKHKREVSELSDGIPHEVLTENRERLVLNHIFKQQQQLVQLRQRLLVSKVKRGKLRSFDNPTLKQAKLRSDWPEWEKAINEELQQMYDEGVFGKTYKYMELPRGANLVGSMYVLQIKRDKKTGLVEKYKARLVALGNQQRESSYDDIKSSTARSSSVKLLLAIMAKEQCLSMVLDVKGAYLKSSIDKSKGELLFLRLPDGTIVELEKYLYGLKQAGKEWQDNVSATLIAAGYSPTDDSSVFCKRSDNHFIMMSLHVDDFLVISSSQSWLDTLYSSLVDEYCEVTVKSGDLLTYLGMAIEKLCDNRIKVSQPAYIKKILSSYNMNDANSLNTPMAINQESNEKMKEPVSKTDYLRIVGSINYLASYTRPDLLYSLSRIAQACASPTNGDMRRAKRILRYINGTVNEGIIFNCDKDFRLFCYVDASFNCYADSKSHYGYSFTLGKGNSSFYARSSKLKIVTLSSTESEYVALCNAAVEVVYLRRLLKQLGYPQQSPTIIYEDNKQCIVQVKGELKHQTSKHVRPKYHYSRYLYRKGKIDVKYLATKEMIADILTKALPVRQHRYLTKKILAGYVSDVAHDNFD